MKRYMLHRNDMPHGGNYRIFPHPDGEYYLVSEVDARIEELEWLVEVTEFARTGWWTDEADEEVFATLYRAQTTSRYLKDRAAAGV